MLADVTFSDNFAAIMKRVATIILFIFTLVQVAPALQSFFQNSNSIIFTVDEEKSSETTDTEEKKEKKEFSSLSILVKAVSAKTMVAFHLAEKIHPSPCLEELTPPPDFC